MTTNGIHTFQNGMTGAHVVVGLENKHTLTVLTQRDGEIKGTKASQKSTFKLPMTPQTHVEFFYLFFPSA